MTKVTLKQVGLKFRLQTEAGGYLRQMGPRKLSEARAEYRKAALEKDEPTPPVPPTPPEPFAMPYDYVWNEETWNASYQNGGLKAYYVWSDKANAPYKEDLWNTVENRAANINDARKDPETGEYVLDENGNYIYDNCERCWKGAVNAPGAKYPWIVIKPELNWTGKVKFSYEGKDDVYPWGDADKTFKNGFGCASVPVELGEEFLLDESGNTTFEVSKFEATGYPEGASEDVSSEVPVPDAGE